MKKDTRRFAWWSSATIVQVALISLGVLYAKYGAYDVQPGFDAFGLILSISLIALVLMMLGAPVSLALAIYYAFRNLSDPRRGR